MKNFILLIFLFVTAWAQAAETPEKIHKDALQMGKASSGADKTITFDTGDGVSNKRLNLDGTTKVLDFNGDFSASGTLSSGTFSSGSLGTSGDFTLSSNVANSQSGANVLITNASATTYRLTNGGLTSIGGHDSTTAGRVIVYHNVTGNTVTINNEDSTITATKRILTGTGNDVKLKNNASLMFIYNATTQRYFLVGGTGGGSAVGESGINLLLDFGFESGVATGWSSSGGTFTSQSYTNSLESNLKYARFVASGAGQYFESSLMTVPDFLGTGCQVALDKYATATDGAWKISALDASSNVLATQNMNSTGGALAFIQSPILAFPCPAVGATVRLRVESLAAATINVDNAYLGSNRNLAQVNCQGTLQCEDNLSATVSSGSVVSGENVDWISSCTAFAAGQITCSFNAGTFTQAPNCTVATIGAVGGTTTARSESITAVSASSISLYFINDAGNTFSTSFALNCQKQGVDYAASKPQNAVLTEAQGWFVAANIGGADVNLGTSTLSTFTEMTSASLDLVLQPKSASAKIACASGTASSGLNCGGINESIGVTVVPPHAGLFEACFAFTSYVNSAGASGLTFQVVETTDTSSAVVAEGGERISNETSGGVNGGGKPYRLCGIFNWGDISAKTVRLVREQTSGHSDNRIVADRDATAGQPDIFVTIRPLLQQYNRPILVGQALLQEVRCEINDSNTTSTTIPLDDTIPQITEGGLVASCPFTPKSPTSKLFVTGSIFVSETANTGNAVIAALFKDATADAIAADYWGPQDGASNIQQNRLNPQAELVSTGAPVSFSLRVGADIGTVRWNGKTTRLFGGVLKSYITIREIAQ